MQLTQRMRFLTPYQMRSLKVQLSELPWTLSMLSWVLESLVRICDLFWSIILTFGWSLRISLNFFCLLFKVFLFSDTVCDERVRSYYWLILSSPHRCLSRSALSLRLNYLIGSSLQLSLSSSRLSEANMITDSGIPINFQHLTHTPWSLTKLTKSSWALFQGTPSSCSTKQGSGPRRTATRRW